MASDAHMKQSSNKSYEMSAESPRQVIQEPYKAKKCYFYRDGDTKFKGVMVCVHPRKYKRLETLITELTTKVKLPFGVRSIFTPRGKDMITSLDNLENGESYVCSQLRQQARGLDPNKVSPPPRWFHDKPSSGTKELSRLLQEQEFKNTVRPLGKKYEKYYQKLVYPYTRTQPKKITMLKNGEPKIHHVVLINRRTAQTFEQILTDISGVFGMAVVKLFTVEGRRIVNLASIINGPDVMVAAGKEPFRKMIAFAYEPTESRVRSRMEMSRLDTRSRMDANRLEMRSRLDTNRLEPRSRLNLPPADITEERVDHKPKKNREKGTKTRGRWKVWCSTNELHSAGTTAQVTLTVYGQKGNSGPIPLGFPDNKTFQPGQMDEFQLDLGSNLGEIFKIRIAHDNAGDHPGWLCDELRMQDEDTEEILLFPCHRWLSRKEDDHETCREIPANRKDQPHLPVLKYEVTVMTGDLWNGGTRSNIYLTIYGERGDSGVRQLYVNNKTEAFNKGQTNHFTIEAVSLGQLKRIIVGHDGLALGDGWFLEKISIQEPDAKPHEVYHFYCGRWLDEGEDDGKIVRELKVQDDYMEDILEKRNWEFEKWKFEGKNQVMLMSLLTGKALRIKPDGSIDGLGDAKHPGSTYIVSSKKPMVRVFTSLFNSNFHLAIDQGRVTGQGRGGPQCEFRIHIQSDRTVMLEGVKFPLQFVTLQENGKLGDPRSVLDKDPAKRFHVYVKGILRHKGIIMLRTSNTQAVGVDHDKRVYATGHCNRAAHFRVHKMDEGGLRMFESMVYPGFYLRLKDGKFDCSGSRNEDSQFLVEKHKYKGYCTVQSRKHSGMYMGFSVHGDVIQTIDTGTGNIHVYPEVVEYGISKHQLASEDLAPFSEQTSRNEHDMMKRIRPEFEDGDYRVQIITAESLDQGQIILAVYGDKGTTGPIILSGSADNGPKFKTDSTDEFKVNLSKIGKLFKVRLEVVPISQSVNPSWKVHKLLLTDMNTQDKLIFNFNCWLSRDRDEQELTKELPVVRPGQEEESLPVVKYFVTVYTGKDPGSETDAEIYITMFGDFGDSGKRELRVSNRAQPFRQGQSDTFEVEAVHLGMLNKIQVGHNETKSNKGWFCDKVVVREGKTANMEFVFPCGRWFDSGMEDRRLERTLLIQADKKSMDKAQQEFKEYIHIWVTTHPDSGNPMQDTVVLYLYGKHGSSGPLTVGSGRDGLFKPGSMDEIKLGFDHKVGKLYKIRIGLAEVQPGYEWYLDKLRLQENSSSEELDFDVGRWMSRKKEDSDVWRELPILRFEEPPLPVIVYTVEVHTSDVPGADTSAAICITLIGQRGDTGKRRLYTTLTEGRIFSQGKIDRFTLEAVYLGTIQSVIIGHSEKKPGSGWHLDYVAVMEYNISDEQIETFFPCDRWFDTAYDDQKTERELFPGQRPKVKPKPSGEYRLWVSTAEDSEPANGGTAKLVIYGDKGHSSDIDLYAPNSTAKLFEAANVDEFEVSTGDIGDIYKIRITREEKADWKAWHLEEIKMEDKVTEESFNFCFDCWLSREMEDGDLTREHPVFAPGKEELTIKRYEVHVTTGDHWAGGTDASVYVILFGSRGDSGRRTLHRSKSGNKKFKRGEEDLFIVEAVDLKDLESLVVGHDGKGPGAGWYLKTISVTEIEEANCKRHLFPCENWLDKGEADGKTERTLQKINIPQLTAPQTLPSECGGKWKVKVRTSDMPGADTRAQVYITFSGTKDYSHPIPLGDSSPSLELFLPGKESIFEVTVGEIGELSKIRLEHDKRYNDPSWHVDWVEVCYTESGFKYLFIFACWLAEDKEDGQTFRERAVESPGWMPAPVLRYIVIVQTGRKPNSGAHEGACTINLLGSQGATGQQSLSHPIGRSADCMKDGMLDVFMLEAVCVGEIRSVRLTFDGQGKAKRWFVESVKVMESLSAISESVFIANTWLDVDERKSVVLPLSETVAATSLPSGVNTILLGHHFLETKGIWDLWIWTSKQDSSGTGAVVSVVLCGTTGSSTPVDINKNKELYAGNLFHTKLEAGRIGEIFKIRLVYADKSGHSCHLEKVKLKDCDTRQEFSFETIWLHCTEDNQDGVMELPAIRPDITPLHECTYKVSIITGDLPCAETSAEVTLMMIGQWGDSGQRFLTKSINSQIPFCKGQIDEFDLRLLTLGKISKILIGHNDYGRGQGWFCQQVAITSTNQRGDKVETVFACNRWFDTGVDDRQTSCEFSPLGTVSSKDVVRFSRRAKSNGIWTCYIKMAGIDKLDVSHFSHSALPQIVLYVYGSTSDTGSIKLQNGSKKMFPGQTYSFKEIKIGKIGDLIKLRVSCTSEDDNETMWTIEEVLLEDNMTGEKLRFDFSRYAGEMAGEFSKELPVIRSGAVVPPLITYLVRVGTDNVEGAGTTAKVYATLHGVKGVSGPRLLHTNGRAAPFRQGEEKVFEIEAVDLGSLEKLVITKGPGDPWLLKQVIVKAGQFAPVDFVFTWTRWIGELNKRNEEVKIALPVVSTRPSYVAVPSSNFPDFPFTCGQWRVRTYTGSTGISGDVTDIVAVFCGSKGESRPISLIPQHDNPFQPGREDIFELSLAEDVGELIKIRLGFEDNSKHKRWHLQKIKFEDTDTKDIFFFAPNDHLSISDVSDGWMEFPVIWPGIIVLPIIKYSITVEIEDIPETASMDQILLKLDGHMGSTGYRVIRGVHVSLPAVGERLIMQCAVEAVSLLSLNSVTVGHPNKNPGEGWYLSRVIVRPSNEPMNYVFLCNRWMDAGEDNGETIRTFLYSSNSVRTSSNTTTARLPRTFMKVHAETPPPDVKEPKSQTPKSERACEYLIKFVTEAEEDAGTDANVYINIIGSQGECGKRFLKHNLDGNKKFARGKTNSFLIEAIDLGDIEKVVVGHDGVGPDSSWKLQCVMIKVQDCESRETSVFPWGKWLTETQPEVTILKGKFTDDYEEAEET